MAEIKITQEELDRALHLAELDEDDVRRDYSGRGMFGGSCLGFVGSTAQIARSVPSLAIVLGGPEHDENDRALGIAARAREDSMGLRTIIYFPDVTVE